MTARKAEILARKAKIIAKLKSDPTISNQTLLELYNISASTLKVYRKEAGVPASDCNQLSKLGDECKVPGSAYGWRAIR